MNNHEAGAPLEAGKKSGRLLSVDVFRGMVMSSMIVAWPLIPAASSLPDGPVRRLLITQLNHAQWHGFTRADFTFAGFVMLVGLSISISLPRQLARGVSQGKIHRHLLTRSLLLFLLGVLFNGGLSNPWPDVRLLGILQRLAICYLIVGLLFLHVRPAARNVLLVMLLLGYWAALMMIPVPEYGAGDLSFSGNLAAWVDRSFLPGRKFYGEWDPEGLLTTIPAVASCLVGVLWGQLLLGDRSPRRQIVWLFLGGCAAINIGLLWDIVLPINKSLWTPSYVMLTAGIGSLLLALCIALSDLWNLRRLTFPFLVVGRNLLVAYAIMRLVPLDKISRCFLGGDVQRLLGDAAPFVHAFGEIAFVWLVLYWMYRRKLVVRL
ncbi:MAG: hypothetical protein HQ582_16290 [Planctomycetes bacterium]|nr:hypothetical protein [Planctomycetota bacterium]